MNDLIKCLNKVAKDSEWVELLYVNNLLLDTIFSNQFGGVTKVLQSIEKTSENTINIEAAAGFGGSIIRLFLDLKARMSAEKKIGEETKSIFESELKTEKKIKLCEISLESKGLILENPELKSVSPGKYLRLVDLLSTIAPGDEEEIRAKMTEDAAEVILKKWQRDQKLTPDTPQVALVSKQPFPMAGIIEVQRGVNGSTYIVHPPPEGRQRSVLAERLFEEDGVVFLKVYWVIETKISEG